MPGCECRSSSDSRSKCVLARRTLHPPSGGWFLIADSFNDVVRAVSAAGVITRVAGTGTAGNSGDDGPATDAQLNRPSGMAVTADGGFLIADNDNFEIRKVAVG